MLYFSLLERVTWGNGVQMPAQVDPETSPLGPECSTHRGPEDDFFCLRYQVWYPSIDCAFRTRFKTAPGCLNCEQGRFNLKRHASQLARVRFTALD
jgi:hypothetical protein